MKKALSIAILFVMLVALIGTGVKAATESTLADKVYAKLTPYGATATEKAKLDKYLKDVAEEDEAYVLAQVNYAVELMDSEETTNVKDLSPELKNEIFGYAQNVAVKAGLDLKLESGKIALYKDGEKIDEAKVSDKGTLAYTGNNVSLILVVSSAAVVALATIFVVRKKFANA